MSFIYYYLDDASITDEAPGTVEETGEDQAGYENREDHQDDDHVLSSHVETRRYCLQFVR